MMATFFAVVGVCILSVVDATTIVNSVVLEAPCVQECQSHGQCCVGSTSACQHPSCSMGCQMATQVKTASDCEALCTKKDGNCSFTTGSLVFNYCGSCPASCGGTTDPVCGGASSADGCKLGCQIAFKVPPASLQEPYPWLNDFNPHGHVAVPESPDPLIEGTWSNQVNTSQLQIYSTTMPITATSNPTSAFTNVGSLQSKSPNVLVAGPGRLMLDFGVERAAWFEFESTDIDPTQIPQLYASISEYNEPWPGKTLRVRSYANGVFRLETNPQLYEGVRFAWIIVQPAPPVFKPFHVTSVKVVSQIRPSEYTGSFQSDDSILTESWYSGAYGVRLNMMPDSFNSILMDRGDRVSIQGDGHPTMATGLTAFGGTDTYDLVHTMLNKTNSGFVHGHNVVDQGIMPYPIYWTMSVNDWYWASGDTVRFVQLVPDVASIIDQAIGNFMKKNLNIGWFGWDDRIGNGFCGQCNLEAQLGFATLTIRAVRDFANSLAHANQTEMAAHYKTVQANLTAFLRRDKVFGAPFTNYGLHASGNLVNADVLTAAEIETIFSRNFNNTVQICSWSPFNQYWILQALGNMMKTDYAKASIRLCWGNMLTLGKGCFWELFSPEWNKFMSPGDKAPTRPSYCHPWASGVTHWLTSDLVGLKPLVPGYHQFLAMPRISAEKGSQHLVASVPTPHGSIRVEVKTTGSATITSEIHIETMVSGVVGLMKANEMRNCVLDRTSVMVDGRSVTVTSSDESSTHLDQLHSNVRNAHWFTPVAVGTHMISVRYLNCSGDTNLTNLESEYPPFPPAVYPSPKSTITRSGGSWIGKYGSAGYSLLAFNNGTDVSKLPSYVQSIEVSGTKAFVGSDANNDTFLQDPSGTGRSLGFATKGADGSQGTNVDINVTAGT